MGKRAVLCVVVFCEICSTDVVRSAERNFTHTRPPLSSPLSLSLSLPSRAHKTKTKTSSARLTSPHHKSASSRSIRFSPQRRTGECGGNETQAVLSLYGKLMPICSQRLKNRLFWFEFYSISTNAQSVVALHWKSWMRYSSQIQ